MGLLDKFKDVLGLGETKEKKKETKKDKPKKKKLSKREKIRKIENIHKIKSSPTKDNGDISTNRKKHRRSLLEEAKNG
jgi:hypothetical protein